MTRPEGAAPALAEDPVGRLSEYEVNHLGDHLVQAGREPDLHHLLALSVTQASASGEHVVSNAWHGAKERIGDLDGYLTDVERAWEAADRLTESRCDAIGHECRYLLLTHSVRSFTVNVPADLVPALVSARLWSPEHAVMYARLRPQQDRAFLLAQLLPALPGELKATVVPELAAAARAVQHDPGYEAKAIAAAARTLPDPIDALEVARAIRRAVSRAQALVDAAARLPEGEQAGIMREALEAARAGRALHEEDEVLAVVVPCLPESGEALREARAIADAGHRAHALVAIAARVPESERTAVLAEASSALGELGPYGPRDAARERLAGFLNDPQQALEVARRIGMGGQRAQALAEVATRLPERQRGTVQREALDAARSPAGSDDRARALVKLAAVLPQDDRSLVVGEALATARAMSIEPQGYRAEILASLVELVPAGDRAAVLDEALASARAVSGSAWTLARAALNLPETERLPVLVEALATARAVGGSGGRLDALTKLAARLPPGERGTIVAEALTATRAIADDWSRIWHLVELAKLVPEADRPGVLRDAVETALTENPGVAEDEGADAEGVAAMRAARLPEIVLIMPDDEAFTLLGRAVAAAKAVVGRTESWDSTLELAATRLPDPAEALAAARMIANPVSRARALASVAQRLAASEQTGIRAEAMKAARGVDNNRFRVDALTAVAERLPKSERVRALARAIRAARAIGDAHYRAWALRSIAQLQPDAKKALRTAREIDDDAARAWTLGDVADRLPEPERVTVLAEGLAATRVIADDQKRVWPLVVVGERLPDPIEAVAVARLMKTDHLRAQVLARLTDSMPEAERAAVLAEAVSAARAESHPLFRAHVLAELAKRLSESERLDVLRMAVDAACEVENTGDRANELACLSEQFPDLPRHQLFRVWCRTLHELAPEDAARSRDDVLRALGTMAPVIDLLAGPKALAHAVEAIGDVHRWFP